MKYKRMLDVMMLILLLFLMAFPLTQQKIHEILGIALFICFVLHHCLNWKWYKSLRKGQYTAIRKLYILINFFLIIDTSLIFLSGLTMSDLLPFLKFMSVSMARKLHMSFTYWGFILMAVHMGLHLNAILSLIRKHWNVKSSRIIKCLSCVPYVISIYGILVFIKNQWISYLLLLNEFLYYEDSIGLFQVLGEHISIFILILTVTNMIVPSFKQEKTREEK